ncbi:ArsR/SmtB family transcription factor [Cohnella massiliensis]|uniref:ArsR/SmtB family transcription factor n=1 Tax=Cohnella massiliensis TaxID=1816691 RepID=UPI001117D053|nr:metalloregulator ArsR/SmtB family transcription factor [Cohnella massiliensis]
MKDSCEIYCYDEPKVRKVQHALQRQDIPGMVRIFKVLADETRMKIAFALCMEDELCVCDVAHIIGSTLATASHHLRMLRQLGLAKFRKEGKLVFYSLEDDHIRDILLLSSTHSEELTAHATT